VVNITRVSDKQKIFLKLRKVYRIQ